MRKRAAGWGGVPLAAMLLVGGAMLAAAILPASAATRANEQGESVAGQSSPAARAFADSSLERIVDEVQRRYNARVVKVTEVMVDGKRAYELRLLSEQRVWTVRVDAETGQELSRND